ncbi:MAG: hypothetical protein AAFO74_14750 [Pseudomonadota bacterium]
MPDFADDAIFIWSITLFGLAFPVLMLGYSLLRVHLSKARLDRLQQEEDQP